MKSRIIVIGQCQYCSRILGFKEKMSCESLPITVLKTRNPLWNSFILCLHNKIFHCLRSVFMFHFSPPSSRLYSLPRKQFLFSKLAFCVRKRFHLCRWSDVLVCSSSWIWASCHASNSRLCVRTLSLYSVRDEQLTKSKICAWK